METIAPGDLVEYSLDGYRFLGLVKETLPAPRLNQPVMFRVEWCCLHPKIFPRDHVCERDLWKVRDRVY